MFWKLLRIVSSFHLPMRVSLSKKHRMRYTLFFSRFTKIQLSLRSLYWSEFPPALSIFTFEKSMNFTRGILNFLLVGYRIYIGFLFSRKEAFPLYWLKALPFCNIAPATWHSNPFFFSEDLPDVKESSNVGMLWTKMRSTLYTHTHIYVCIRTF